MPARILDGRACAQEVEAGLAPRVAILTDKGVTPHLAVVLVGGDHASQVYVKGKVRACARVGIKSTNIEVPVTIAFSDLLSTIDELNADLTIHGILVQSPLPPRMDELEVSERISVQKDVDGFHPANLGLLVQARKGGLVPCTPAGVLHMLEWGGVEIASKRVVIVGRSRIVGMPLALLLARKGVDATVTIAHSRTPELPAVCCEADVLIAAVGVAGLVKADWVKPGAVVVDVGVNRIVDADGESRLSGDVDPAVAEVASVITPVPGGVGPMTIAMLMQNTVTAAELQSA
jgi:methylenetetrahydrofolate dehydrogenase (NADP+)/methenyltetrahydrofolate cyclohydrolase